MKNKLVSLVSVALLMVGVACQSSPAPKPVEPTKDEGVTDRCPMLHLQQSIPDHCCYVACKDKNYPGAAFKRCQSSILKNYDCTTAQYMVVGFTSFNICRCN